MLSEPGRTWSSGLSIQPVTPELLVEHLLAGKEQTSFFSEDLEIVGVYHEFEKIAAISGKNSQREKLLVVRKLLANASPLEGRYLARIMLEDLRIGVGEGNIREAVAKAFSVDPALVEHAMQALNDLGLLRNLQGKERWLCGMCISRFSTRYG